MRGRSQRGVTSSSEPDDWGDGSWTVDCVCGVNFDDGEEMVNCDECGVWVHTRCVRFIKGETSFLCDKCKCRRRRREETEETEVAQLLAELPNKTLSLHNANCSNNINMNDSVSLAPTNSVMSFRPPSEIRIADRVHVQGVPGGEESFFEGFGDSVFTRHLWICTGYVPKKLNFQYREFPCWDEDDDRKKEKQDDVLDHEEGENKVTPLEGREVSSDCEKGAAILCQVVASKEKASISSYGPEWRYDDGSSARKAESKRTEGKVQKHHHHGSKNEKHHSQHHHGHHHSKRKKDEWGSTSKDHSSKKRLKSGGERDRDEGNKRRGSSQDRGYSSRVHRSGIKNPKTMRNLAAQKFLDDDDKVENGGSGYPKPELSELLNYATDLLPH